MKTYEGTYFEIAEEHIAYKLNGRFATLKDAKEARSEHIIREEKGGYKPSKYIIIRTIWSRVFNEDGKFHSEQSSTMIIQEAN